MALVTINGDVVGKDSRFDFQGRGPALADSHVINGNLTWNLGRDGDFRRSFLCVSIGAGFFSSLSNTLTVNGNFNITDNSWVHIAHNGDEGGNIYSALNVSGDLNISGDSELSLISNGGSGNDPTIHASLSVGGTVYNYGRLISYGGDAAKKTYGSFSINNLVNNGTFIFDSPNALNGTFNNVTQASGYFQQGSTNDFHINGTLTVSGGTLSNNDLLTVGADSGKFSVGQTLNLAGGAIGNLSTLTQVGGSVVVSAGSYGIGTLNKSNGTLSNAGTLTVTNFNQSNGASTNTGNLTIGNANLYGSLSNTGTLNLTGTVTSRGNLSSSGTLNNKGSWTEANAYTISGNLNNTGSVNFQNGFTLASNSRLTSSGTLQTNNVYNIFDSLGTTGQQDLHYVSLNSTVPQEVKTSLSDFFQKYVAGTVAQDLINHASFSGGTVIITGVNITQTQADDLVNAFKSKFGSAATLEFQGTISGISHDDILTVSKVNELYDNVSELQGVIYLDRNLEAQGTSVLVGNSGLRNNTGFMGLNDASSTTIQDGKELTLIGTQNDGSGTRFNLASNIISTIGEGSKLILGSLGLQNSASYLGQASQVALSNGGALQIAAGDYRVLDLSSSSGKTTVDAGAVFTADNASFASSELYNRGTSTIANSGTSANILTLLSNTGTLNLTAGDFSVDNLTTSGQINNSGTLRLNEFAFSENGKIVSSGTLQADQEKLFSVEDSGADSLNVISLNAAVPQTVRNEVTEFFRKYNPENQKVLDEIVSRIQFTAGKLIVANANITETQKDDLTKAFHAAFGDSIDIEFRGYINGVSENDTLTVAKVNELYDNEESLRDVIYVDKPLDGESSAVVVGDSGLKYSTGFTGISKAATTTIQDGKELTLIGAKSDGTGTRFTLADKLISVVSEGAKLILGSLGLTDSASYQGEAVQVNLSNGGALQIAAGDYKVKSHSSDNGTTTVAKDALFSADTVALTNSASFENNGETVIGALSGYNNASFTNNSKLTVEGETTLGGRLTNNKNATLVGTVSIDGVLQNSEGANLYANTINVNGTLRNLGYMEALDNSTVYGTLENPGEIRLFSTTIGSRGDGEKGTIGNTYKLIATGKTQVSGLLANASGAEAIFTGDDSALIVLDGGTVSNNGTLTADSLTISDGGYFINGDPAQQISASAFSLRKAPGANTRAVEQLKTLTLSEGGTKTNNGTGYYGTGTIAGTFINADGALSYGGVSSVFVDGDGLGITNTGVIHNAGVFTFGGSLTNAGTIDGDGTVVFQRAGLGNDTFTNSGTIAVGTLSADNITYAQTAGTLTADSGWFSNSTVNLTGGTMEHDVLGEGNTYNLGTGSGANSNATLTVGTLDSSSEVYINKGSTLRAETIAMTGDKTTHLVGGRLSTTLNQVFNDLDYSTLNLDAVSPEDRVEVISNPQIVTGVGSVIDSVAQGIEFAWGTVAFDDASYSAALASDAVAKLAAIGDVPSDHRGELEVAFNGKAAEHFNVDLANSISAKLPDGRAAFATFANETLTNESTANTGATALIIGSDSSRIVPDSSVVSNVLESSMGFMQIQGVTDGVYVNSGKHLVLVGKTEANPNIASIELADGAIFVGGNDTTGDTAVPSKLTLGSYGTEAATRGHLAEINIGVLPSKKTYGGAGGQLIVKNGVFDIDTLNNGSGGYGAESAGIVIGSDTDRTAQLNVGSYTAVDGSTLLNDGVFQADSIASVNNLNQITNRNVMTVGAADFSGQLKNEGKASFESLILRESGSINGKAGAAEQTASMTVGTLTIAGNALSGDSGTYAIRGALTNKGTLTVENGTTVAGDLVNDGTLTGSALTVAAKDSSVENSEAGNFINNLTADIDALIAETGSVITNAKNAVLTLLGVNSATEIAGTVENAGNLKAEGTQAITLAENGSLDNTGKVESTKTISVAGGTFSNIGEAVLNGLTVTAGQVVNAVTGIFKDSGTTTINMASADDVAVKNEAVLELTNLTLLKGVIEGGTVGTTEATVASVAADGSIDADTGNFKELANAGKLEFADLTVAEKLTNTGSITTDKSVSAGSIENSSAISAGTTVNADSINNTGTITAGTGLASQSVSNTGSIQTAELKVTTGLTNSGSVTSTGKAEITALDNQTGGVLTLAEALVNGGTNAGELTASGLLTLNDVFSNTGTLTADADLVIAGNADNRGTLKAENGKTTITGTLSNSNALTLADADLSGTFTNTDKTAEFGKLTANEGSVINADGGAIRVGDFSAEGMTYNQTGGTFSADKGWFNNSTLNIMGGVLDASNVKDSEGNVTGLLGKNVVNISGANSTPAIDNEDTVENKSHYKDSLTQVIAGTVTSDTTVNIMAGGVLDVETLDLDGTTADSINIKGGVLQTSADQIFESVTTEALRIDAENPETGTVQLPTNVLTATTVGAVKDEIQTGLNVESGNLALDDDYFSASLIVSVTDKLVQAFENAASLTVNFLGQMAAPFTITTANNLEAEGLDVVLNPGIVLNTTTLHNEFADEYNKDTDESQTVKGLIVGGTAEDPTTTNSINISMGFKDIAHADNVTIEGGKELVLVGNAVSAIPESSFADDANKLLKDSMDGGSVNINDGTFTFGSQGGTTATVGWINSSEITEAGTLNAKNGEFADWTIVNNGAVNVASNAILHTNSLTGAGSVSNEGKLSLDAKDGAAPSFEVGAGGFTNKGTGSVLDASPVELTEVKGALVNEGTAKYQDMTIAAGASSYNKGKDAYESGDLLTVSSGASHTNEGTSIWDTGAVIQTGASGTNSGTMTLGNTEEPDKGIFEIAGEFLNKGTDAVLNALGVETAKVAGEHVNEGTAKYQDMEIASGGSSFNKGENAYESGNLLTVSGSHTNEGTSVWNTGAVIEAGASGTNSGSMTLGNAEAPDKGVFEVAGEFLNKGVDAVLNALGVETTKVAGELVNEGTAKYQDMEIASGGSSYNKGKDAYEEGNYLTVGGTHTNEGTSIWKNGYEVSDGAASSNSGSLDVDETFIIAGDFSNSESGSVDTKDVETTVVTGSVVNDGHAEYDDMTVKDGGNSVNNGFEQGDILTVADGSTHTNTGTSIWNNQTVDEGGSSTTEEGAKETVNDEYVIAGDKTNKGEIDATGVEDTKVTGTLDNQGTSNYDDMTIGDGGVSDNSGFEQGDILTIGQGGEHDNSGTSIWNNVVVDGGDVNNSGDIDTDKLTVNDGTVKIDGGSLKADETELNGGDLIVGNDKETSKDNAVKVELNPKDDVIDSNIYIRNNGDLNLGSEGGLDWADELGAPQIPDTSSRLVITGNVTTGNGGIAVGPTVWTDKDNHVELNNKDLYFADGSTTVIDASILTDGKSAFTSAADGAKVTVEDGATLILGNIEEVGDYTIVSNYLTAGNFDENGTWIGGWNTESSLYALPQDGSGINWILTLVPNTSSLVVNATLADVRTVYPDIAIPNIANDDMLHCKSGDAGADFVCRVLRDKELDVAGKTKVLNSVANIAFAGGVMSVSLNDLNTATDSIEGRVSMKGDAFTSDGLMRDWEKGSNLWVDLVGDKQKYKSLSATGIGKAGFDTNSYGLVMGFDRKLSDRSVILGGAFSYNHGSLDSTGDVLKTKNKYNSFGLHAYGAYSPSEKLNIVGTLSYLHNSSDITQSIHAAGFSKADADVKTSMVSAGLRAETTLKAGKANVVPHAGLRYVRAKSGSYDTKVDGKKVWGNKADASNTFQMPIGVAVRGDFQTQNGWNVRPQADVSVIPQIGNTRQKTKLTNANGVSDRLSGEFAGRFGANVNLGVQADKGNATVGVRYGFTGGTKGKADHAFKVEARFRF